MNCSQYSHIIWVLCSTSCLISIINITWGVKIIFSPKLNQLDQFGTVTALLNALHHIIVCLSIVDDNLMKK